MNYINKFLSIFRETTDNCVKLRSSTCFLKISVGSVRLPEVLCWEKWWGLSKLIWNERSDQLAKSAMGADMEVEVCLFSICYHYENSKIF